MVVETERASAHNTELILDRLREAAIEVAVAADPSLFWLINADYTTRHALGRPFEPEQALTEDDWKALDAAVERHPASLMLWEGKPRYHYNFFGLERYDAMSQEPLAPAAATVMPVPRTPSSCRRSASTLKSSTSKPFCPST